MRDLLYGKNLTLIRISRAVFRISTAFKGEKRKKKLLNSLYLKKYSTEWTGGINIVLCKEI